jgi:hypothetical protein
MGIAPGQLNRIDAGETGGEAQDWFVGIVDRVVAVGPTIQLECKTDLPVVPWKLVPDDGSDPRDRGLKLPYPLGAGAVVRCVNLAVGSVATLGQSFAIGQTSVLLDDASEFQASGTAMIGAESFVWLSKSGNSLVGDPDPALSRAQNGTLQANHIFGTGVIEIEDLVLGVASESIASVTGLFLLSPTTNSTVEVPSLIYTVDTNDEATEPGGSGSPITTITMDGDQLMGLLHAVYADATVTQQPAFAGLDPPDTFESFEIADNLQNALFDQASGATGTWASVTGGVTSPDWTSDPPTWTYVKASALQQGIRIQFDPLDGNPPGASADFYTLKSMRFDFTMNVTSITSPITFGLQAFNVEGKLQGVIDGELVAAGEVSATGVTVVTGTSYLAVPNVTLKELDTMFLDLIKSDIAGGNPTAVVEITDVRAVYFWTDDTTSLMTTADRATYVEVLDPTPGVWRGVFVYAGSPATVLQVQDNGEDQNRNEWVYITSNFQSVSLPDPARKVETAELRISGTRSTSSSGTASAVIEWSSDWSSGGGNDGPFNPSLFPQPLRLDFTTGNDQSLSVTQDLTPFINPGADITFTDDFVNRLLLHHNEGGTGGDTIELTAIELELQFRVPGAFEPSIQTQESQIEAAAGGTGLQFFAVCDGPEISDADSPSDEGELMSHPADVIYHWLTGVGGIDSADLDLTSFDDSLTNLGSGYSWGFDARNLGADWGSILLQLAYESRANVANLISSGWSMLTAQTTHDFPAAAVTIDSYGDLITIGKDDAELKSRLTVYFAHDPRFESSDNRSFQLVKTTDPTLQAVIDREEEFGRNDAEPYFLFCSTSQGATGVDDWKTYFEQELGRFARLFACRVDHWQSYPLELGDVITFQVGAESIKARVIEVTRSERQGFLLRFAEVL